MVQFHNPAGERSTPVEPYALGLSPSHTKTATIGLLANGFPDSVTFLDAVERSLKGVAPAITTRRYNKGNASTLASQALVDEIASECDALITAYGH